MKRTAKQGFTLIELLVVIGIISMLIAIALPAIQSVRERARQTSCEKKLKEFATAAIHHEQQQGYFPGYMKTIHAADNSLIVVGWLPQLFPFLDLIQKARQLDAGEEFLEYLDIAVCPSETPEDLAAYPYPLSYAPNAGKKDVAGPAPDAAEDGVFHDHRDAIASKIKVSLNYIIHGDGSSNTILFSENVDMVQWNVRSGANALEYTQAIIFYPNTTPEFPDDTPDDNRPAYFNAELLGDPESFSLGTDPIYHRYARPSSWHTNGVNIAYADGSVRIFNVRVTDQAEIDSKMYPLYRQKMTPFRAD